MIVELDMIFLLIFVGLIAGFLNVVAGGGSLLTLPLLIFLGLPSSVANGTNRIAILTQSIVSVASFRKSGFFNWKFSLLLGIPAVIGSIIGANFAITLSDDIFNKVLSIVMVAVLITILWPTKNKETKRTIEGQSTLQKIIVVLTFFMIGFYGGFIQAGVGFLIIVALSAITQLSLIQINSIKVFVIGVFLVSSLAVFVLNDQVNWTYGLSLALGTGAGGYFGTRFAIKSGEKWIKMILVLVIVGMAINLWFF